MAKKKISKPQAAIKPETDTSQVYLYVTGIIVIAFIAYFPSFNNLFTGWDDQLYITNNPHIRSLSFSSIKAFFGTYEMGNYHPLTMFTLALNYHFSGLDPWSYHTTNFILHLANTLLVFVFIRKLCGDIKVSAIVSLLFAIHPMHVESVAWVSERKDVLYTFFYLGALCIYMDFLKTQKAKTLLLVFLLYVLSLFSKGVAVTLPLVLLLLDYYSGRKIDRKALLEKLPFFLLSIVFGVVAIYAQASTDALTVKTGFTFFERILFSSYGILAYLSKLLLPFNLACFYDYPVKINGSYPFLFYISPVIVLGIAYMVYKLFRRNKDIVFASLFFISTIFLVLQILPVGKALYADRYTYVAYIGFFFLIAKGVVYVLDAEKFVKSRTLLVVIFCSVGLIFMYQSNKQCRAWKNNTTLWTNALHNAPSAMSYYSIGEIYMEEHDTANAIAYFDTSIDMRHAYIDPYINRSHLFEKKGLIDKALADCDTMISISPNNSLAYGTKASCLIDKRDYNDALIFTDKAIQKNPVNVLAYVNKGLALYYLTRYDEAINAFSTAIAIDPTQQDAFFNRSGCYYAEKKYKPALDDALKAKELGCYVDDRYIELLKKG